MKKVLVIAALCGVLSGCGNYQSENNLYKIEEPQPLKNVVRTPIPSSGDFSGKILTGKKFNNLISKMIEDGSWK
ncbi:hypothetical protein, partial [Erwinia sp. OAMSP11]